MTPLPFEKPSATRWLARGKILFNMLMSWHELKAYFVSAEANETRPDARYKARLIK